MRPAVQIAVGIALAIALGALAWVLLAPGPSPRFHVGTVKGRPGASVTVAITLEQRGAGVRFIAPLQIEYDNARLTPTGCSTQAPGKSVFVSTTTPGMLGLAVTGSLDPIPDGAEITCQFAIDGAAPAGPLALRVRKAGTTDGERDIAGEGADGAVIVE